jgi:hypothetical protein
MVNIIKIQIIIVIAFLLLPLCATNIQALDGDYWKTELTLPSISSVGSSLGFTTDVGIIRLHLAIDELNRVLNYGEPITPDSAEVLFTTVDDILVRSISADVFLADQIGLVEEYTEILLAKRTFPEGIFSREDIDSERLITEASKLVERSAMRQYLEKGEIEVEEIISDLLSSDYFNEYYSEEDKAFYLSSDVFFIVQRGDSNREVAIVIYNNPDIAIKSIGFYFDYGVNRIQIDEEFHYHYMSLDQAGWENINFKVVREIYADNGGYIYKENYFKGENYIGALLIRNINIEGGRVEAQVEYRDYSYNDGS